jgi:hypothetical protein
MGAGDAAQECDGSDPRAVHGEVPSCQHPGLCKAASFMPEFREGGIVAPGRSRGKRAKRTQIAPSSWAVLLSTFSINNLKPSLLVF